MKNLTLVILFFISSIITCNAQEPTQYTKAVEFLQQGKQDSLKVYLENWENTEPKQAEIYALWLNYYFYESEKEIVSFTKETPEKESLAITDSTGNTVGYFISNMNYDEVLLQKGYDKIDEGIALYPNRLDFYYGKAKLLFNYSESYKECFNTLEKIFIQHKKNKGNWDWTLNKPLGSEADTTIINSTQHYIVTFLDAGQTLFAEQLTDIALEIYPNNTMYLADKAAILYNNGDIQGALNSYLNILKNTPNDYLVVFNVAYLYETLGDYKNAKKYYKMVKKSRDPQISQQATEALDYLKSNKK